MHFIASFTLFLSLIFCPNSFANEQVALQKIEDITATLKNYYESQLTAPFKIAAQQVEGIKDLKESAQFKSCQNLFNLDSAKDCDPLFTKIQALVDLNGISNRQSEKDLMQKLLDQAIAEINQNLTSPTDRQVGAMGSLEGLSSGLAIGGFLNIGNSLTYANNVNTIYENCKIHADKHQGAEGIKCLANSLEGYFNHRLLNIASNLDNKTVDAVSTMLQFLESIRTSFEKK